MKTNRQFLLVGWCTVLSMCPLPWSVAGVTVSAAAIPTRDDPTYAVKQIPAQLLPGADAIVRRHEVIFESNGPSSGVQRTTFAVTIFNDKGRDFGRIRLWYDHFSSIEELEGVVLDETGDEIAELEEDDVLDIVGFDGFSLYQDSRYKYAELMHTKYPYTVVFNYEIEYKGILEWPTFLAQSTRSPVQFARFEMRAPVDQSLRWWCNRSGSNPQLSSNRNDSVYVWEFRDLPLLEKEEMWNDYEDLTTVVRTAPNEFELEGYRGVMSTWKDYGTWLFSLWKGLDEIPPEAATEALAVVGSATDSRTKIDRLYRYVQNRTRYVSVQLGIGGYKPFAASYVHERGYGDCKALSNYMIGLLRTAGVTAYPVLIRRGFYRRPMIAEFPSNQFNHVIVCVPQEEDTLWLECTSQINPSGMIGPDNERRPALLFSKEGGKVVYTPVTSSVTNMLSRTAEVTVRESGSAGLVVSARYSGNQQDDIRSAANELSPLKKQEWVQRSFGITDATILSFAITGVLEKDRDVGVELQGNMPTFVSKTARRHFIPLNPFTRRTAAPREVKKRLSPVMYKYAFVDIDTVKVRLPEGYNVEALPENTEAKTSFGSYSTSVTKVEPLMIRIVRRLELTEPIIPAERYEEYRTFFSTVAKADKAQIVLVRP